MSEYIVGDLEVGSRKVRIVWEGVYDFRFETTQLSDYAGTPNENDAGNVISLVMSAGSKIDIPAKYPNIEKDLAESEFTDPEIAQIKRVVNQWINECLFVRITKDSARTIHVAPPDTHHTIQSGEVITIEILSGWDAAEYNHHNCQIPLEIEVRNRHYRAVIRSASEGRCELIGFNG